MSLHDRIMGQMPDDITNEGEEYYDGFAEAGRKAAQIAKEADAQIEQARQIIADLAEYAEQNDPGCPHIGRAKGFLSGGGS